MVSVTAKLPSSDLELFSLLEEKDQHCHNLNRNCTSTIVTCRLIFTMISIIPSCHCTIVPSCHCTILPCTFIASCHCTIIPSYLCTVIPFCHHSILPSCHHAIFRFYHEISATAFFFFPLQHYPKMDAFPPTGDHFC